MNCNVKFHDLFLFLDSNFFHLSSFISGVVFIPDLFVMFSSFDSTKKLFFFLCGDRFDSFFLSSEFKSLLSSVNLTMVYLRFLVFSDDTF